jgi:hypothetical protein
MSHETEAVCLLRTGNLFVRRAGLRRAGESAPHGFIGVKPGTRGDEPGAFAVYLGDEPCYHFDMEGRWQRMYDAGIHYRKDLSNAVVALERRREGAAPVMRRRVLSFAEVADRDAQARAMSLELLSARDELVPPPPGATPLAPDEVRELLDRVSRWDAAAWFRHREAFLAAYDEPPSLPPDARLALPFQARRPEDGEARASDEFAEHIRKVLRLYGRRIEQAKGTFLSAQRLFQLPPDVIATNLAMLQATRLGRAVANLDDLTPPLPDRDGWSRLAALGLERVWIGAGLEDPQAVIDRAAVWSDDDLRAAVRVLHDAGIAVSLPVRANPPQTTIDLVPSLDLKRGDTIFVLDACDTDDGPSAALLKQLRAIKPEGVKIVSYDPGRQPE